MTVFWSSLIFCFHGTLLRYFLNDFEMVPVAYVITDTTFVLHYYCYFYYNDDSGDDYDDAEEDEGGTKIPYVIS